MIDIDLRKKYPDFDLKISYCSEKIGITALLGRSGAGKTSVINMVSGLNSPDEGHIIINGRELFNSKKRVNIPTEKRRFGYVFQEARLFPHLTVMSNLTYGMKLVPESERYISVEKVLDLLDLSHLVKRRPSRLSGGEKQRVAIGRALLTSPYLLLMDEPLASLDDTRKNEVLPFIQKISTKLDIPVLYVTHSMDEILRIAEKILVINEGQVKISGDAKEVLENSEFENSTGAMHSKGNNFSRLN